MIQCLDILFIVCRLSLCTSQVKNVLTYYSILILFLLVVVSCIGVLLDTFYVVKSFVLLVILLAWFAGLESSQNFVI